MADHTLGTIRGTIEIDYDGAGIVRAVRDTDKLKGTNDRLNKSSSAVLSGFAKAGKGAALLGGAISTVTNASGLLVGTLSVLGPLAAAGFAAAPAVILGYASVMAVAKVATAGVGEALAAAGEDAKKFDESIKDLSPNAQAFAKSFRAALPGLKAVQQSMQDAFFKNTAPQVAGVAKAIASLKPEATAVSGSLGEVATNIVKTATSGQNIGNLRGILAGVNDFLQRIKTSIGPVVTGFLGLAKQGAAFGGVVGGSLASQLAKLANWLSTIDVAQVFRDAAPIVQALGQFFGDIAVIAKELFSIFIGDGANAAGVLGTLASGMATFLQSAQGQAALAALRDAMAAISGSVGQIFMALLQALAPIIVALAPGFATLAGQIAGVLVPALAAVTPLLTSLATFISNNMSVIGPLAGVILAAAAAYKVWAAGAAAVNAVQGIMNSRLAVATGAWIRNTAAVVANRAAQAVSAAITGGAAAVAWTVQTAAIIANRAAQLGAAIAMGVVRAATIAWTAVQWALNIALNANPIGLIVIAIAALVAGIIYAYQNSETFRNIVQAVWAAIKTAISATVNWITGVAWPAIVSAWNAISSAAQSLWGKIVSIWNAIKNSISTAINAIRSTVSAVWSAIVTAVTNHVTAVKTAIQNGFNAAKAVVQTVLNGVKSVVSTVWRGIVSTIKTHIAAVKSTISGIKTIIAVVRNAFNNAKTAAQTALTNLVSLVRGLPGRVTSALGNIGSLLRSKGVALVQGFISGIKSMIGNVKSAAKSVVTAVTDFLPGSPAKTGPLSGKGYVLKRAQRFMGDFSKGVKSKRRATVDSVKRLAEQAARAATIRKALAAAAAARAAALAKKAAAVRAAALRAKELAMNVSARTTANTNRVRAATARRLSASELSAKVAAATAKAASQAATSSSSSGSSTTTSSSGGTRTYTIKIGSKTFTTLVVDAITGNPVAVAKAANEGNRKKKSTGSGRLAKSPIKRKITPIRRLS